MLETADQKEAEGIVYDDSEDEHFWDELQAYCDRRLDTDENETSGNSGDPSHKNGPPSTNITTSVVPARTDLDQKRLKFLRKQERLLQQAEERNKKGKPGDPSVLESLASAASRWTFDMVAGFLWPASSEKSEEVNTEEEHSRGEEDQDYCRYEEGGQQENWTLVDDTTQSRDAENMGEVLQQLIVEEEQQKQERHALEAKDEEVARQLQERFDEEERQARDREAARQARRKARLEERNRAYEEREREEENSSFPTLPLPFAYSPSLARHSPPAFYSFPTPARPATVTTSMNIGISSGIRLSFSTQPEPYSSGPFASIPSAPGILTLLREMRRLQEAHQNAATIGDPNMNYEELLRLGEHLGPGGQGGVGEEDVQSLPTREYRSPSRIEGEKCSEQCTICLAEYVEGETLRTLPCLHSYHQDCIDTWLHANKTCPICKHAVV